MASEMQLKYGCNPNQKPSRIFMADNSDLPITVLNGKPGYINLLDAFNGWQLVRESRQPVTVQQLRLSTFLRQVLPLASHFPIP